MLLAMLFRKVLVVWGGGCTCLFGTGFETSPLASSSRIRKSIQEEVFEMTFSEPALDLVLEGGTTGVRPARTKTSWRTICGSAGRLHSKNRFDNISFYDIDYCSDKRERRDLLSTLLELSSRPGITYAPDNCSPYH